MQLWLNAKGEKKARKLFKSNKILDVTKNKPSHYCHTSVCALVLTFLLAP